MSGDERWVKCEARSCKRNVPECDGLCEECREVLDDNKAQWAAEDRDKVYGQQHN